MQDKIEQVAQTLPFLATGDIVYDRDASICSLSRKEQDRYNTQLRSLLCFSSTTTRKDPTSLQTLFQQVTPLLQHANSKVRTLAMIVLFHTEHMETIRLLTPLLEDNAPTFPCPNRYISMGMYSQRMPLSKHPMKSQTVSKVAKSLLKAMVGCSLSDIRWNDPPSRNKSLNEFWSTRKDRDHYWIGWYEFRMTRATQGIIPIPEHRTTRIYELVLEMNQSLPPLECDVYKLAILGERDRREYLDGCEEQLLQAARRLGSQRLLSFLRAGAGSRNSSSCNNPPLIDDPDWPFYLRRGHVQKFIHQNAKSLFQQQAQQQPSSSSQNDVDEIIALARTSQQLDAYIAAATLVSASSNKKKKKKQKKNMAHVLLHEAFDHHRGEYDDDGEGRAKAAIAMWKIVGESEADFLVEWFFTDRYPDMGRPPYRAEFVQFLFKRFNTRDRKLVARILRDDRLDQLDLPTHKELVQGLNRNVQPPIIDPNEEYNTSHPLGECHFDGMIDRAWKEDPIATKELLKTLATWRTKLRESIPTWE